MQSNQASQLEERTDDVPKVDAAVALATRASLQAQLRATRLRRPRVAAWPRAAVWQLSVSLVFHPIHSSRREIHTHFHRCGQNVSCKEVVTFDCTAGARTGKFHFSYCTDPDTVTSGLS